MSAGDADYLCLAGPTASGKSAAADQKKYCVAYDGVVGSRVTKQECKTKAEWAKDRVDIDKLLKGE